LREKEKIEMHQSKRDKKKGPFYEIGRKKWKKRPANPMVILEKTTKPVETMQASTPPYKTLP